MLKALGLFALIGSTAQAQDLRVVGGERAQPGDWPDVAGIVFGGQYVGCTGTLILPNLVLTAEHCTWDRPTHVILNTTDWTDRDQGEIIAVQRAYAHPRADIAVLVLEEDSTQPPRTIAAGCVVDEYLDDGVDVAIVGFGLTSANDQWNSDLHEGWTIVQDADCDNAWLGCDTSLEDGAELYAGGDGVDACSGDSGGPLYLPTEVGTYVVGATSRGPQGCRQGAIWVRPDTYVDWIEEKTGLEIPIPTCNFPPDLYDASMTVPEGRKDKVQMIVEDDGDVFTWDVYQQPEHGRVTLLDNGEFEYEAYDDYVGWDSFVVQVTDDGIPAHTALAEVQVAVTERSFLGCSTTGSSPMGALGLLGVVGLVGRRRRRG